MKDTPAFPTPEVWGGGSMSELKRCDSKEGMTLRDYFAGQVLIGSVGWWDTLNDETRAKNIAEWSYWMADAMLKEKEKRNVDSENKQ
jgi:hypothetical protein